MRCSPSTNSRILLSSVVPAPRTRTIRRGSRSSPPPQNAAPRRANEVLVRFRGVQTAQQKNDIAAAHGLRRQRSLRGESGIEKLLLAPGMDVDNAVFQLLQDPAVESAEPNFLASVNLADNNGETALMKAAASSCTAATVSALLAAGADLNARDHEGRNALDAFRNSYACPDSKVGDLLQIETQKSK